MREMYKTDEGFELARPLLLDGVRNFHDILTFQGEYDRDNKPAPYYVGENEIGPYCSVDLSQIGGEKFRSISVTPTSSTKAAIADRLVTDDDRLSFKIIAHKGTNRALVILQHGHIVGSHYLAYIDPATIPAPIMASLA